MLSKKDRIKTERFEEIIKNGKTIHSSLLYTKFLPNKKQRFAVSVPKKIVKTAVGRHFLKRRIMCSVYNNKNKFPFADYIIFVKPQFVGTQKIEFDKIIEELAKKVASQI